MDKQATTIIRMPKELKKEVQKSANKYVDGNLSQEIRTLLRLGLEARKKQKTI